MKSFLDILSGKVELGEPAKYTHTCPHCEDSSSYNFSYEAYFCRSCDLWLEKACGDESCQFCAIRPATPSSIIVFN